MALFERKEGAYRRTRSLWDRIKDVATMDAVTLAKGLEPERLDDLEETLIAADFGAAPASKVVEEVRGEALKGRMRNERDFRDALRREMLRLVAQSSEETALRENPREGAPSCKAALLVAEAPPRRLFVKSWSSGRCSRRSTGSTAG